MCSAPLFLFNLMASGIISISLSCPLLNPLINFMMYRANWRLILNFMVARHGSGFYMLFSSEHLLMSSLS